MAIAFRCVLLQRLGFDMTRPVEWLAFAAPRAFPLAAGFFVGCGVSLCMAGYRLHALLFAVAIVVGFVALFLYARQVF